MNDGFDELDALLKRAQQQLPIVVAKALYQFAEEVMTDSKMIVPVETGALMNTGKVMPPVITNDSASVTLGYGDTAVDYALIVHEELQTRAGGQIKWTRPGSGPKYLTNPLQAKQAQLPGRVLDAVKAAFK
jgi:hypothetical protein